MPSSIQRHPTGLSEVLALVGERAPSWLGDQLAPTIQTLPFYLAQIAISVPVGTNGAVSAPGNLATVPVPAGATWWIVALQAALQATTVGDMARLSVGLNLQRIASAPSNQTAVAATARLVFSWAAPQPLILTAGAELFAAVDDISLAAGTRSLQLSVIAYDLSLLR